MIRNNFFVLGSGIFVTARSGILVDFEAIHDNRKRKPINTTEDILKDLVVELSILKKG